MSPGHDSKHVLASLWGKAHIWWQISGTTQSNPHRFADPTVNTFSFMNHQKHIYLTINKLYFWTRIRSTWHYSQKTFCSRWNVKDDDTEYGAELNKLVFPLVNQAQGAIIIIRGGGSIIHFCTRWLALIKIHIHQLHGSTWSLRAISTNK